MIKKLTLTIEKGALLEAPIYENHKRGKNWLAKIKQDPKSFGGLHRVFFPKAKGQYLYLVEDMSGQPLFRAGQTIEWGADYYSGGSGNQSRERVYSYVVAVDENKVVIRNYKSSARLFAVIKRLERRHAAPIDPIAVLMIERKKLEDQIAKIDQAIASLRTKAQ